MANKQLGWLVMVLVAGCTTIEAGGHAAPAMLCEQARTWGFTQSEEAMQIPPNDISEKGGRTYRFDLAGRGGMRTLRVECGWGSYAECAFQATQVDGRQFAFSDLSTFGLWDYRGTLYLLYRIVDPKTDIDATKRRVVKVGDPPVEACNRIGDYSDLM
jgi:hypothetical protein